MTEIIVKDRHKTRKGVEYGYCRCGVEVNRKEEKCKYCGAKLIWDEKGK